MKIPCDMAYYQRAYNDELVGAHPETARAIHAYMEALDADMLGEMCVILRRCSDGYWYKNANYVRAIDELYDYLKEVECSYNVFDVFAWYEYYSELYEERL